MKKIFQNFHGFEKILFQKFPGFEKKTKSKQSSSFLTLLAQLLFQLFPKTAKQFLYTDSKNKLRASFKIHIKLVYGFSRQLCQPFIYNILKDNL